MNNETDRGFLAENWLWIVVPFLLVVGGLSALMMMTGSGGEEDDGGAFVYNVF